MTRSRVLLPKFWGYEVSLRGFLRGSGSPILAFHFIGQPTKREGSFFKRVFDIIVGQKTLKFVAISATPRRNCGQALRRFTGNSWKR
jgi:hypothetical protein